MAQRTRYWKKVEVRDILQTYEVNFPHTLEITHRILL